MADTEMSRLTIIITLAVFLTAVYLIEGIVISAQDTLEDIDANRGNLIISGDGTYPQYLNYTYDNIEESGADPMSMITGFFGFLAFAPLELPVFIQFILTMTTTLVGVVLFYLTYTFIRDWIPFI